MFGLGLLAILGLGAAALYWLTALVPGRIGKALFLAVVVGGAAFYPFAYRFSASYASFLALCDQPDRVRVLRSLEVDYVFLDRDLGADCKAGPKVIGALAYAGFDCEAPGAPMKTAFYRYAKKADWHAGCGLECFDTTVIAAPQVLSRRGHRQGIIADGVATVTYENGRMGAPESPDDKLRFSDTQLLDGPDEMAYARSYTYYPYGSGWATILGAASGSAPSMRCKNDYLQWNVLDVYKPRGRA